MDLGKILGDLIVAGQGALTAGMQSITIYVSGDGVEFSLTLTPAGLETHGKATPPVGGKPHEGVKPGPTGPARPVR
jgi:hypothetical protein